MSRRVPDKAMVQDNRVKKINTHLLPTSAHAVQLYRGSSGTISDGSPFGHDPLAMDPRKLQIREAFKGRYPSFEELFHNIANSNPIPFRDALKFYIDVTFCLSRS